MASVLNCANFVHIELWELGVCSEMWEWCAFVE